MRALLPLLVSALLLAQPATAQAPSFITFESGPVKPLALSPNGGLLFAANTPNNRLDVFTVFSGGGLSHVASIPVGLEPVAVAARSNGEVWALR